MAAPVVTKPATQNSVLDDAIVPLQVALTSGESHTWAATGLPTGLTIAAGTGIISGTPTKEGTFTAKVKDTNAASEASAEVSFTWEVAFDKDSVFIANPTPYLVEIGGVKAPANTVIKHTFTEEAEPNVLAEFIMSGCTVAPATTEGQSAQLAAKSLLLGLSAAELAERGARQLVEGVAPLVSANANAYAEKGL
jgi:hypothetical protein